MARNVDSKLRTVLRVASGNYLEMFDFMIFGYYASSIAKAFFPAATEYGSLMLSLTTFGAGFLMRPPWRDRSSGSTSTATAGGAVCCSRSA